jgi:lipoprotein-releasing system permease protein
VAVVALVLAFVAAIYPSWRAARVNPAEALRYE